MLWLFSGSSFTPAKCLCLLESPMILPCCTPGVCSLGFWLVMGIEVLDLQP